VNDRVVDDLATAIESAFGGAVDLVRSTEDSLTIRFRRFETAVVTLAIADAERPSFRIGYPLVKPHHSSISQAEDVCANGVLLQGVLGIVGCVAESGVALPEFPHPHVLKQLRRRGGKDAD